MNPIFGVLMSAAFLGETEGLGLNYIAALIIISVGITLVNRTGSR
jgi:drug/metabolite transporter (DMT)-like permease